MRVFAGILLVVAACDLGSVDPEPPAPSDNGTSEACSGACHGSGGTAAPPRDTLGRSDVLSVGVGAHAQHVGTASWHKPVECGSCHVVPDQIGAPGHIDTGLPAEVIFNGMGTGGAWDHDAQTCTNTYCHGATLSNTISGASGATAGGTATSPKWTLVDGSQSQCGSCHGAPPPDPHPADPDCGKCHPTMTPGGGMVIAYPDLHIDGHLDVIDTQACDSCHGQNGQSAPPKDTLGNMTTTSRGVGAHAQHMAANSPWHAAINCNECHKVPAGLNDQGHVDSPLPAELVFGPLAGATSTWDGAKCSNTYCHGAALMNANGAIGMAGGSKTAPTWTQVDGTQAQCGSCHGAPPPAPHPSDSNCGSCHPTMTPGNSTTITYPALHIDGKVDLIQDQACDACHGSGGNAAPPKDLAGNTTTDVRGVGAHRNHLAPSTWRKDIACDACHKVPTSVYQLGHIDTPRPAEVAFAPLAGGAIWNGTTCTNTYCHGSTLGGGTSKNPVWTVVNGAQGQCGSCHGTPPPAPHPVDSDCGKCHDTMTAGGGLVITDPARHIDGNLDVTGDQACNSCHGGTNNAPPKDSIGNTATTTRGVGAHQAHLATTNRFKPVDCTDCHKVPGTVTSVGHLDTPLPAELTFSARAGTGTAFNGARCSNSYCHGAALTQPNGTGTGGSTTSPQWTKVDGTQVTCTGCHGNPPPLPHPQVADCGTCHSNVQVGSPTTFTDPLKHVDGNVDVTADQACNSCHGGTNNAPPKDTTTSTSTTSRGVGAHQAHLASATWHRTVQCAECHKVPASVGAAGHVDTPLPAELTFTGIGAASAWNGSTCTSYCHGSTLPGGTAKTPLWTKVDGTQAQCASCHGNPPPAPHPANSQCSQCHADAGAAAGTFTNPAQHIDGTLQVSAVHPPGYAAREAHGHDFDTHGSSTCATAGCHGTALTGGNSGGPSCAKSGCHSVGAAWQTTCTFCHGTSGQGAPPAGVFETDTAPTSKHVGAHAKHVGATTMHAAWDCSYCHTTPSSALTPGHVDGTGSVVQAEVKYSSLNPSGAFTAATTTCTTLYCHGNGRTSAGTAVWTSTTALSCSSCHLTPAPGASASGMSGRHDTHVAGVRMKCNGCHQTVVNTTPAIIAPALHVNGLKDVKMPTGTYTPSNKSCSGLPGGCHGTKTWN